MHRPLVSLLTCRQTQIYLRISGAFLVLNMLIIQEPNIFITEQNILFRCPLFYTRWKENAQSIFSTFNKSWILCFSDIFTVSILPLQSLYATPRFLFLKHKNITFQIKSLTFIIIYKTPRLYASILRLSHHQLTVDLPQTLSFQLTDTIAAFHHPPSKSPWHQPHRNTISEGLNVQSIVLIQNTAQEKCFTNPIKQNPISLIKVSQLPSAHSRNNYFHTFLVRFSMHIYIHISSCTCTYIHTKVCLRCRPHLVDTHDTVPPFHSS